MFIAIEGIDGSGKATQTRLLKDYWIKNSYPVETIDFPRYYDNFFGKLIAECLRGEHGDFVGLDPKIASALYACDRLESKQKVDDWLQGGFDVFTDRYTTSSLIHQGGKLSGDRDRQEFVDWLFKMEYDIMSIPKPDMVIYLDVPLEISIKNLRDKKESYTASSADVHENDHLFLLNSRNMAHWLVKTMPDWYLIDCFSVEDDAMLDRDFINKKIINLINTTYETSY